jgi:hypothetical protein
MKSKHPSKSCFLKKNPQKYVTYHPPGTPPNNPRIKIGTRTCKNFLFPYTKPCYPLLRFSNCIALKFLTQKATPPLTKRLLFKLHNFEFTSRWLYMQSNTDPTDRLMKKRSLSRNSKDVFLSKPNPHSRNLILSAKWQPPVVLTTTTTEQT